MRKKKPTDAILFNCLMGTLSLLAIFSPCVIANCSKLDAFCYCQYVSFMAVGAYFVFFLITVWEAKPGQMDSLIPVFLFPSLSTKSVIAMHIIFLIWIGLLLSTWLNLDQKGNSSGRVIESSWQSNAVCNFFPVARFAGFF